MTEDEVDAYAERVASQVINVMGAEQAPGVILQALIIATVSVSSLDATVFVFERTIDRMRAQLASELSPTGQIQ